MCSDRKLGLGAEAGLEPRGFSLVCGCLRMHDNLLCQIQLSAPSPSVQKTYKNVLLLCWELEKASWRKQILSWDLEGHDFSQQAELGWRGVVIFYCCSLQDWSNIGSEEAEFFFFRNSAPLQRDRMSFLFFFFEPALNTEFLFKVLYLVDWIISILLSYPQESSFFFPWSEWIRKMLNFSGSLVARVDHMT